MALAAREELRKLIPSVSILLTREKDVTLTEGERLRRINTFNPHICISIHHNSATNKTATGVEVFHAIKDPRDDELAKLIVNKISATGIANRGIKTRANSKGEDYYYIIRQVMDKDTISVLVEGAFVSNPKDAQLMKSGWLNKQAKAIAEAIHEYVKKFMPELLQALPYPPLPKTTTPAVVDDKVTGKMIGAYILDGVTYVPVRALAEACGLSVGYDGAKKLVTIAKK